MAGRRSTGPASSSLDSKSEVVDAVQQLIVKLDTMDKSGAASGLVFKLSHLSSSVPAPLFDQLPEEVGRILEVGLAQKGADGQLLFKESTQTRVRELGANRADRICLLEGLAFSLLRHLAECHASRSTAVLNPLLLCAETFLPYCPDSDLLAHLHARIGRCCGSADLTACKHFEDSFNVVQGAFGKDADHSAFAASLCGMGRVLMAVGELDDRGELHEALECYKQSLEMYRRLFGDDSDYSDITTVLLGMARALKVQGNMEAMSLQKEGEDMHQRLHGETHEPASADVLPESEARSPV